MGRQVVVGVDGSAASRAALRWALEQARCSGKTLLVLHALGHPGLTPWPVIAPSDGGDRRERAAALLDREVESLGAEREGVEVRRMVADQTAARALLEAAQGADLLVLGSTRHGRLRSLGPESISWQVAHHASCPVTLVPVPT